MVGEFKTSDVDTRLDPQLNLYRQSTYILGPDRHTWCATPDYVPWCQREPWQRHHQVFPARHTLMAVNGSPGVAIPDVIDTIAKRQWLKDQMQFLDVYLKGRRHNASSRTHVGKLQNTRQRKSRNTQR